MASKGRKAPKTPKVIPAKPVEVLPKRDPQDWINVDHKVLVQLFRLPFSLVAFYKWLLALFFVPRAKGSDAPKATSRFLMAPFYLFPASMWPEFEKTFESAFKEAVLATKNNTVSGSDSDFSFPRFSSSS